LTPVNFTGWQYGQHAPMITSQGDILLYDDGNFRAQPPNATTADSANYSRAVQYHVDQQAMTVSQVWDFGSPSTVAQTLYTGFLGDADEMPQTGNVLTTFGAISYIGGQATNNLVARVIESTKSGQVVFQLNLGVDSSDPAQQQRLTDYRADRIPTLNP
ncbi:MAG TPA: aryl-sulfate sulfotransferase, partial [bacterium]|nr:aryl-sulfate sulfotransferase [bacterium]